MHLLQRRQFQYALQWGQWKNTSKITCVSLILQLNLTTETLFRLIPSVLLNTLPSPSRTSFNLHIHTYALTRVTEQPNVHWYPGHLDFYLARWGPHWLPWWLPSSHYFIEHERPLPGRLEEECWAEDPDVWSLSVWEKIWWRCNSRP